MKIARPDDQYKVRCEAVYVLVEKFNSFGFTSLAVSEAMSETHYLHQINTTQPGPTDCDW